MRELETKKTSRNFQYQTKMTFVNLENFRRGLKMITFTKEEEFWENEILHQLLRLNHPTLS